MKHLFSPLFYVIIIVCLLCSIGIAEKVNINSLVNKIVVRNIDLSSQLATHNIDLTIENTGKSTDYVLLALQTEFAAKLSYLEVYRAEGGDDANRKILNTTREQNNPSEYVLYRTKLGQSLEQGASIELRIELVFTHTMTPFPNEITQSERQLVKYSDNHYWFSVYKTESQRTKVKLSSSSVQSNSELSPSSVKGDVVTYGPYKDVVPLSYSPLSLHFENNKPFITINQVQRWIEISNWGNIAVEEQYKISHDGAKLKGSFSRYDFQINAQANGQASVQILDLNLPDTAADVYYRDDIGNISTSAWRVSEPKQKLELRPRFPMFGGWKTEFTVGYNLPTYPFLGTDYYTGKYILKIPFIADWDAGIAITSLTFKVVLPEGSSDVKVNAPFDVDVTYSNLVTYLDSATVGRPVVVITKNNLVNHHSKDIEISYSFNSLYLFWEPFLLVAGFFSIFLIFIGVLRIELSIEEVKASLTEGTESEYVEETETEVKSAK